jgi:hypothetical protein
MGDLMNSFTNQPRDSAMTVHNDEWSSAEQSSETWKELFAAALLEFDNSKLPERISVARAAIVQRMEEWQSGKGGDYLEAAALQDALQSLRSLENVLRK